MSVRDNGTILILFLIFMVLALAALIVAWLRGRAWGDLSSRRHFGEALTEEEQKALKRSRRSFFIWAGVSLVATAFAFFTLQ